MFKKSLDRQKHHFGRFWQLIFFLCFFKNTDLNNICASIVFKAKTNKYFLRFLFQNLKMHFFQFFEGQRIFFFSFFSVLAFKTIDA